VRYCARLVGLRHARCFTTVGARSNHVVFEDQIDESSINVVRSRRRLLCPRADAVGSYVQVARQGFYPAEDFNRALYEGRKQSVHGALPASSVPRV
jgi:hypothetical protein